MGVKYNVEGEPKLLDSGRIYFRIEKDIPTDPDWWPKPYEFESYDLEAKPGQGGVVDYHWCEGAISGEGEDGINDEKRIKVTVDVGKTEKIGSVTFEGY